MDILTDITQKYDVLNLSKNAQHEIYTKSLYADYA
jgi:hypothetical protein